MKTKTLKKDDFIYLHHLYPSIFAKLVWTQGLCVITVLFETNDNYVVSSAGAFGLIDIPKIILD